jgi:6-pyruvoyltetrahydropterin/6-carboxytetrahydropterin synthase
VSYTISKDFAFSASHQLPGLAVDHPCGRLHGHNYTVRVTICSDYLDEHGFVLDYGLLKSFGLWIDAHLDHRHLNDFFARVEIETNPTAEALCAVLYSVLGEQVPAIAERALRCQVSVSETPKTWASYPASC